MKAGRIPNRKASLAHLISKYSEISAPSFAGASVPHLECSNRHRKQIASARRNPVAEASSAKASSTQKKPTSNSLSRSPKIMSTANFSISSNRGRRLLPALIDEIAVNDPARVVFSYPLTPSLEDGFRDVTFKEFANAINRCSWLLKEKLGHCDTFKTLTYMGPSDQRYIILIFAAIKTGYKVLQSHRKEASRDL